MTTSSFNPIPSLTFRLNNLNTASKFSPRLGQLTLARPYDSLSSDGSDIEVPTPGLLCSTTRGIIQHLSRDNVRRTPSVKWVNVPFESFLQVDPPVPVLQGGNHPLHTFLGFPPDRHILSMSLRDPADGREMPANGKLFIAAQSSRGTRKVTCPAYRSYVQSVLPDIVFPLSDVPFTLPPHSQKRITKSIERSAQWLTTILAPLDSPGPSVSEDKARRLNVFLPMAGGIKSEARAAFAAAIQEPLEQREKELLEPLETLDEGVSGYVFDLVPLRTALLVEQPLSRASTSAEISLTDLFVPLIKASLLDLPETKPRLVNTTTSPHEVLALILDAGVDLFDTLWAQRAATWGVALDFRFPAPRHDQLETPVKAGKRDVGHNLYDGRFAHDFGRLADSFLDGLEFLKRHPYQDTSDLVTLNKEPSVGGQEEEFEFCSCAACSPTWENHPLSHSTADDPGPCTGLGRERAPPYTRAYVHHLLHTHEMSAHALLVMHNLTVMDAFMHGVRKVLRRDIEMHSRSKYETDGDATKVREAPNVPDDVGNTAASLFATEVARFKETYDANMGVLDQAGICWAEVDRARGKGRLARERARKLAEELGVEVTVPPVVVANIAGDVEV